jgi:hypothetical protein
MATPAEETKVSYGGSSAEVMFVERRSRRTALVLTTIAVVMVACAKLSVSGALQPSSAVGSVMGFDMRTVLEEEAPAGGADASAESVADEAEKEPVSGEEGADGRSGEALAEGGNVTPFNPATVGWDKSQWTSSDWATWIVPGPIITMVLVGFIFYMYGPMWAVGTAVVMIGVDALAFYTNA